MKKITYDEWTEKVNIILDEVAKEKGYDDEDHFKYANRDLYLEFVHRIAEQWIGYKLN